MLQAAANPMSWNLAPSQKNIISCDKKWVKPLINTFWSCQDRVQQKEVVKLMSWRSSTEGVPSPKQSGVKGESSQPLGLQVGVKQSNLECTPLFVQSVHGLWCLGFSLFTFFSPYSPSPPLKAIEKKVENLLENLICSVNSGNVCRKAAGGCREDDGVSDKEEQKCAFLPVNTLTPRLPLQLSRAHTFFEALKNGLGCDRQLCMTQLLTFSMCWYPAQDSYLPKSTNFLTATI